jgi:hypothetical protein
MREVLLLTLTMLAAKSSVALAAPVGVVAGQICHVFSYTGQSCTAGSSFDGSASCATSSFCTLPLASCTNTNTSNNSTGCIATPQGTINCDGSVQSTGNGSVLASLLREKAASFVWASRADEISIVATGRAISVSAITKASHVPAMAVSSAPSHQESHRLMTPFVVSAPLSISFSNGSYSTQNIPASQSGRFSFTWTAETSTSTSNTTASSTQTAIPTVRPTAMTTFFGTFSVDAASTSSSSNSSSSSVRGQAAHAADGGGAPGQAASTTTASAIEQTGAAPSASEYSSHHSLN